MAGHKLGGSSNMKAEIRITDYNGNTAYKVTTSPIKDDYSQPELSIVDKKFYELNTDGKFCYGLMVIVALIKYYKYDYSKWYDFLIDMSDIPGEGFGKRGPCSFDCIDLIKGKDI